VKREQRDSPRAGNDGYRRRSWKLATGEKGRKRKRGEFRRESGAREEFVDRGKGRHEREGATLGGAANYRARKNRKEKSRPGTALLYEKTIERAEGASKGADNWLHTSAALPRSEKRGRDSGKNQEPEMWNASRDRGKWGTSLAHTGRAISAKVASGKQKGGGCSFFCS